MSYVAGIDVGSTYTKAIVMSPDNEIVGRAMDSTGFKLDKAAERVYDEVLEKNSLTRDQVDYVIATGYGRHRVPFCDLTITDLTATARGSNFFFPDTRTVLDIGGQTMKASRLDDKVKVKSFRLNDKCAAGTGAFLEKTAHYMGYSTEEIGPLVHTSHDGVSISGVCAVFAESEVINQLSIGSAPADIMRGAMFSLVKRCVQLMKRVRMEPQFTLAGGIIRFPTMVKMLIESLEGEVNVAKDDMPQYATALGAAVLARQRLTKVIAES
ncbi:MAG TPA: acyl-CoA dehydratase activase [Candidatus Marinimicrobia bacterium]|jgi:predicted CoA-substrate-specific enzyme activase|nr:2-hydroxyglutaryl-CoA dehydratase [Candidatus Neomarinimicrobiota bacterium]MDP7121024.1 acyl-CoA dehydratase activase [Candidatus Neomarinimicrobiota bacterium]MDP7483788.1 acyl-CoA dehydratase activase [Candidatus Neomarinimicrobiota bacterium]MDP7715956.1 acyl-CoA dehydratase activase [Candidatus Neomarinimicrobiota bacterium]HJL84092.1 acyl-CoA dehydratase activase [Candidatus Neomarinimicrobiota bacterium]|tara:strand:+ start:5503 stop:6306 length:804 start_codon:yes stop_codon:yes gene_type:complete